MQNVLNFPTNRERKKSLTKNFLNFIENCRIRKEESFQNKIEFLKNECYEEFLEKILKQHKEKGIPDFPDWMYRQRRVICIENQMILLEGLLASYDYKEVTTKTI